MKNFFFGKGWLPVVVILLVTGLIVLLFFLRRAPGPYHAIPSQAAIVLEFNGLHATGRLLKNIQDEGWRDVLETSVFRNLWQDAALAEKLFAQDAVLKNAFDRNKLLAGLTLNRADSLHGLFVLDVGEEMDMQKLLKTNGEIQKVFPSVYRDQTIYTFHLSKRERLVATFAGNLLLFSRYSYLVEDAISQLDGSSSWWADRKFLNVADDKLPLRVYFRSESVAGRYAGSMNDVWKNLPALLRQNITWAGFGWNGKTVSALVEPAGFWSSMSAWGEAAAGNIYAVLPDNTALLARAAFANPAVFFGKLKTVESADFEQYILPWAGKEAALVITEPFSKNMTDDRFIVLAVGDSAEAVQKLRAYGSHRGLVHFESYHTYDVFEFLSQSALQPLIGESDDFRNPCCAMIGSYVVFSNNRSALELWIDKYIVNQTLANNTDFLQLQQQISGLPWNAQVLINAAYLPLLLKNLLNDDEEALNSADLGAFAGAGFVGSNINPSASGLLKLSIGAQPHTAKPAETSILWKTPLADVAITQPFLVDDMEKGETAVLVQDAQFRLYRLNAGGTIVWRRQMEGPVLSPVRGIDFRNNGTLCYLFNTADRIWLLDDEGQDMEGYPLELLSQATNGVTVVDFDNNLKFNYFIACANGNLYGYDQFGRPLPGWNPQGGVGRIEHPVLHFQRDNKDYLAALNREGKLFVFGRNGAERFAALQFSGKNFGPPQADAFSKLPRIVCANGAGMVFVCNLQGGMSAVALGKGGKVPARLAFTPLSGDARYEYALAQDQKLTLAGYEKSVLKTYTSRQLPVSQDTVFALPENRIGTLNRAKRQIFMFDGNGDLFSDFPLAGTTPFALSGSFRKNSGQVLVVGDGSSVYAYKIR